MMPVIKLDDLPFSKHTLNIPTFLLSHHLFPCCCTQLRMRSYPDPPHPPIEFTPTIHLLPTQDPEIQLSPDSQSQGRNVELSTRLEEFAHSVLPLHKVLAGLEGGIQNLLCYRKYSDSMRFPYMF